MDVENVETNVQLGKAPTDQNSEDAHDLAAMGHTQSLTRKFNIWSMLALAFCVLGELLGLFCRSPPADR